MKRQHLPFFVSSAAILVVGAVVFDVPVSNPVVLAAVLACPLMMIFMMAGGHRGGGRDRRDEPEHSRGDHTAIRGPAGREQGR